MAFERALAFERLVANLSATFVHAPAARVDAHVIDAIKAVGEFLDLDRAQVGQTASGGLGVTHQWTRDEAWRVPPFMPAQAVPAVADRLRRGVATIASRMSEIPFAADREFIARFGTRSVAIFPIIIDGRFVGGVTFGTIRREQEWTPEVIGRLQLIVEIIGSALARKAADLELRAALTENERLRGNLERENVYLQEELAATQDLHEIVGRSPALRAVLHKVDQVAATDASVLILGETGTGKELIARALHAQSGRSHRPLIAVNCAALPPSLIESELFGHEKGAFTGATQTRAGRFEIADGSTLFLDEIGDLDPALQAKLLRALQDGEITRLGASVARKVSVRVIAASNRDLVKAMDEGRFRDDLYYRLSVFPIEVPPLRERRADIPLLVWHFIQSRQRALGRDIKSVPEATMDALVAYDWPGNVRELQNIIERALILSTGPVLRLDEAFSRPRTGRSGVQRPQAPALNEEPAETLADAERAHIESVLRRCAWRIEGAGQAAARLGLRPSTLRNRMRKLGIRRPASG
jgi:transcriptional regulator with GAF, ATPase, and Fis domain